MEEWTNFIVSCVVPRLIMVVKKVVQLLERKLGPKAHNFKRIELENSGYSGFEALSNFFETRANGTF